MSFIVPLGCLFIGAFCLNIALRLPEYGRKRDEAERQWWRDTEGTFHAATPYQIPNPGWILRMIRKIK